MKRALKIIALGIIIGFALVFVQKIFTLPEEYFVTGICIFAAMIVILSVLFNAVYNIAYYIKVEKAQQFLKDGKYKKYINSIQVMKKTVKGSKIRLTLDMEEAKGYTALNDYSGALALLEPIQTSGIKGELKLILLLSLCMNYIFVQPEKMVTLYLENKAMFDKFKKRKRYKESIMHLEIYAEIYQGNFEQAKEMVKELKETSCNEQTKSNMDEMSKVIEEELAEKAICAEL